MSFFKKQPARLGKEEAMIQKQNMKFNIYFRVGMFLFVLLLLIVLCFKAVPAQNIGAII